MWYPPMVLSFAISIILNGNVKRCFSALRSPREGASARRVDRASEPCSTQLLYSQLRARWARCGTRSRVVACTWLLRTSSRDARIAEATRFFLVRLEVFHRLLANMPQRKKLSRSKAKQLDVREIVSEIEQPKAPLALRLSALLMRGVVHLYSTQVIPFFCSTNNACRWHRPNRLRHWRTFFIYALTVHLLVLHSGKVP